MMDGVIVPVSLLVICETCSQVCGYKTNLGIFIFHSDGYCSLVTGHARHASLLDAPFDILDMSKHRGLHEDT